MSGSGRWPEGWTRDNPAGPAPPPRPAPAHPSAPSAPQPLDETQVLPPHLHPRGPAGRRQPSAVPPARPPTTPKPPRQRRPGRARRWAFGILATLLLVVVVVVGTLTYFVSRIAKVDAVRDYAGRPAAGAGTNWLVVGSDSREGLTDQQVKTLHLGRVAGRRTDTIILLHRPTSGAPTLVSLPRDSYVSIPGHGRDKLNAAYAFGGAPLLVQTVEQATGLRIDHYTEIGFGGFVGTTDAVGGVQLCPRRRIDDQKSGLHVAKGCQQMAGATALAYVRARYFDPQGDLGRVKRQQEFLGAVFAKATSPATLFNPFRVLALSDAATTAMTDDDDDGLVSLVRFALTMRGVAGGSGRRTTVPVANINYRTPTGASAVRWDRTKALALFQGLRAR